MPNSWFEVDKDGLREIFANLSFARLIAELIQNCFDTDANECRVTLKNEGDITCVTVYDNNPDGFKDIRDCFTLFKSTAKRHDVTKRGRYNAGEKIVFSRAIAAEVKTTKGCIRFDAQGRHELTASTKIGSCVTVQFPKWTTKEMAETLEYLQSIYVPAVVQYELNGVVYKYVAPRKVITTKLSTELLKETDGVAMMTRTQRRTAVHFHKKRRGRAYLYELGLPVIDIDGLWDVDVQQKIPLSQDRTLVPPSYLQDIYAEMLMAMHEELKPGDLGQAHVRLAMEDERVSPAVAAQLFNQQFGDKAVIQSHNPDSDQEAARAGATIVSSRTFGSEVNAKLREGGVHTTKENYCRDLSELEKDNNLPDGYREVKDKPERQLLREYVQMLSDKLCGKLMAVHYAMWDSNVIAFYKRGESITFNVKHIRKNDLENMVDKLTATILHELGHAVSLTSAHDGVYDHKFEQLVNLHTVMLLDHPEYYRPYRKQLRQKAA